MEKFVALMASRNVAALAVFWLPSSKYSTPPSAASWLAPTLAELSGRFRFVSLSEDEGEDEDTVRVSAWATMKDTHEALPIRGGRKARAGITYK